jgi:hypothetical protein
VWEARLTLTMGLNRSAGMQGEQVMLQMTSLYGWLGDLDTISAVVDASWSAERR